MTSHVVVLVGFLLLVGCTQQPLTPSPMPTPHTPCSGWQANGADIACLAVADTAFLFQSLGAQTTLNRYQASIVLRGTLLLIENDEFVTVATLEGETVIGANGRTQVLALGRQLTLTLTDNIAQTFSEVDFIPSALTNGLPLDRLPRPIDTTAFIILPTPFPSAIPTIFVTQACPIPDDWFDIYTVQSGDTLAEIAARYDLSVTELAEGNCLANIARINIGQQLRVPSDTVTPDVAAGATIGFRADDYTILEGNCTVLRWDFTNIAAIYIDDDPITTNFLQVCPDETTVYSLRVLGLDDSEIIRELTISVRE